MTADAEEIWRAFLSHCRARPDGSWLLGHEYPAAHLAVFEQYGKDELERVGLIDGAGFPKWHDAYEDKIPVRLEYVRNRAGEIVALRGTWTLPPGAIHGAGTLFAWKPRWGPYRLQQDEAGMETD